MLKHYDERTEFPDETDTCATVHPPHPVGGRWSRADPWRMTPVGAQTRGAQPPITQRLTETSCRRRGAGGSHKRLAFRQLRATQGSSP